MGIIVRQDLQDSQDILFILKNHVNPVKKKGGPQGPPIYLD